MPPRPASRSRSRPGSNVPSRINSPAPAQQSTPPASNVGPRRPDLACAHSAHLYDTADYRDRYFTRPPANNWQQCLEQPCPNRYNPQTIQVSAAWAASTARFQEDIISQQLRSPTPSAAPNSPTVEPPPQTDPLSSMSSTTNTSNGERGSKPEDFMGKRSKSRRWLAAFNNYLCLNKI